MSAPRTAKPAHRLKRGDVIEWDYSRATVTEPVRLQGGHSYGPRVAVVHTTQATWRIPVNEHVTVVHLEVAA